MEAEKAAAREATGDRTALWLPRQSCMSRGNTPLPPVESGSKGLDSQVSEGGAKERAAEKMGAGERVAGAREREAETRAAGRVRKRAKAAGEAEAKAAAAGAVGAREKAAAPEARAAARTGRATEETPQAARR